MSLHVNLYGATIRRAEKALQACFRYFRSPLTLKGIFVLTVETKTPILSLLWSTLYELQLRLGTDRPHGTRGMRVQHETHEKSTSPVE